MFHRLFSFALIVSLAASGTAGVGVTPTSIQEQIDALAAKGGGTVVVPKGEWVTKPIALKSNITLKLEDGAVLLGSTNLADYACAETPGVSRALVNAVDVENAAIVGKGRIDGRGHCFKGKFVDPAAQPKVTPMMMKFVRCRNLRLEDFTYCRSASWAIHLVSSDGVEIRRLKCFNHCNLFNDGIDIESRNVLIEDCEIDSEDDALCFKSESDKGFLVENVTVRGCRLASTCNHIKFGTGSYGMWRNILIENCILKRSTAVKYCRWDRARIPGVREKITGRAGLALEVVDGGRMENVTIRNITMKDGIGTPLFARLGRRHQNVDGQGTYFKNVLVENVKMTHPAASRVAPSITGVPGLPISGITLRNCDFLFPGGGTKKEAADTKIPEAEGDYPEFTMFDKKALPAYGLYLRHVDCLTLDNVKLRLASPDCRPAIWREDVRNLRTAGCTQTVEVTKTNFPVNGTSETGTVRIDAESVAYEHMSDAPGRFSLAFCFPEWEQDTWVFMPSCAYNGNRNGRRTFCGRYPPSVSKRNAVLEPEQEQIQVPALEPDGSGVIEVTTGDMATPCAGFFFPKAKKAVLVFTEQEVGGLNLGFTVRAGTLRVDYPANRSKAYRLCRKDKNWPDKPLALARGEKLRSRFRVFEFDAADVSALMERFFRERKCLLGGARAPNGYTKELWALTEKAWNDYCWIDGAYCQEIFKWVPGWTGGPNSVYPLYRFGNEQTRARCRQTLDFLMRHQSKYGFFYGRVVKGKNVVDAEKCGPLHEPNRHLLRCSADALYFLIRCGRQMGWTEAWKDGARRCADAFVRTWRKYGQFGQWIDIEDGRILVGRSTSCSIAPAALYEAWKEFGDPSYREVALASCADYCVRDLDRGITYGGPGDIVLATDSESAFSLLESCVVLAEETKDPAWLRRARQAAALCSTWVVSYRYRFPPDCTFAKLDVNTVGAVFASVQNKCACPGICTLSGDSLLRLYRMTGDVAYLDLCKDIASCLPQLVSCAERPIAAKGGVLPQLVSRIRIPTVAKGVCALPPGFISERVSMGDWEGVNRIGETFCAFCWCGTSLLVTWADLMTQPEFGGDGKNE